MEYVQKILFVRLKGGLNYKNCYKIENYVNSVIKKHQIENVVYNLKYLNNIDIVGIDTLLHSKYLIRQNKGTICFCNIGYIKNFLKPLRIKEIPNEETAKRLMI